MSKKKFILICIAAGVIITGGLIYHWIINIRIALPNREKVARIELAYYDIIGDRRVDAESVTIKNPNDINTIIYALSDARLSNIFNRWNAMNESPLIARPWVRVFIYSDEHLMRRIYLYTMGNRGYVFDAYRGLYRIDPSIITEIFQIWHEKQSTQSGRLPLGERFVSNCPANVYLLDVSLKSFP